jgi:hypothetical protein
MSLSAAYHHTFDAARLVAEYPPRWGNRNKAVVFDIACPAGCKHSGTIAVSRWPAPPLPDRLDLVGIAAIEPRADVFDYQASLPPVVHWYLNFAHSDLFCSYGGGLFAQDEMQVAEHPALGSLREAMLALGIVPFTVQDGTPSPILIRGVQRRCRVATDPNGAEGRPEGLYGNRFMAASTDVVTRATTVLDPPTVSNILAMEAPVGSGHYSRQDIAFILSTALTGFTAARLDSGADAEVIVHTGYWGCGAYGGNRVLMSLLQIIAAATSGIYRLVFHTVTPDGMKPLIEAQRRHAEEIAPLGPTCASDVVISEVARMGFEWGESDGN